MESIIGPSTNDVSFWMGQITEHALFLSKLLNPATVMELKREANDYYLQASSKRNSYDPEFLTLFYAFLETIKTKAKDIKNINLEISHDDFCDLVKHMILEQTYFVRLVNNKMTVKEEIMFWLQEAIEHTTLVSHLLPTGQLKLKAIEVAQSLRDIRTAALSNPEYLLYSLQAIKVSIEAALMVNNEIIAHKVNIDQSMLFHEIRESEYGFQRIGSLIQI